MTLLSVALYVLIGLCAGVMGGLFGIGGGIVIVPALILFARFAPHAATGTSLAVFLLPVAALGAWTHYKAGNVRVGTALLIAAGVFLGSYFGARIATQMSPLALKRAFAVFLTLVAVRMWFGK